MIRMFFEVLFLLTALAVSLVLFMAVAASIYALVV